MFGGYDLESRLRGVLESLSEEEKAEVLSDRRSSPYKNK
jgi:hypothetical protein